MKKWFISMLAVAMIMLLPVNQAAAQEESGDAESNAYLEQYWEIYQLLQTYHLSAPTEKQLTESAIKGMMSSLNDPYTYYMNEEEYQQLIDSINGSQFGVGIYLVKTADGIMVEELITDSPAAGSGLLPGDFIMRVNGHTLGKNAEIKDLTSKIDYKEGSKVTLTVDRWRNQMKSSHTFTIEVAKLDIPLTEAYMLNDRVGYLKLSSFGLDTEEQMRSRMNELAESGMSELILDLRRNSGGYLDSAAQAAKLFRESGVLLHAADSSGEVSPMTFSEGSEFAGSLVVLIDEGTASASEVLAGFLQDSGAGYVIGSNSFGKGTIQQLVALKGGGVLRITIEEYFTPDKHRVHGQGIAPDTHVPERSFQLAKAFGHLTGADYIGVSSYGAITFNGIESPTLANETYVRNGKVYIAARTLMDWFGGEVEWDQAAKAIVMKLDGKQAVLTSAHSALTLVGGRSFVDIQQLKELLPLQAVKSGDSFTISRKQ